MTTLAPCRSCARHLRVGAAACPFCGVRDPLRPIEGKTRWVAGVSRGALLALGTTLALVDCSSNEPSDGTIAQPYGAPPIPPDADIPAPPYGAVPIPVPKAALSWKLNATPTALKMSQRATFRLEISVLNDSAAAIDPKRGDLRFLVDGKPSQVADLAFSNGAMEASWRELPPGATAKDARELGKSLFEKPGTYVIELQQAGVSLGTVSVQVTAD